MNTTYTEARPKMRSGDVVIWSGVGPVAQVIKWRTGSKWTHASLIVRIVETGVDRVFITEAIPAGLVFFPLSRRLRDFKGTAAWLPLVEDLTAHRDGARRWALDRIGRPYDFESLLQQLFRRVSANARALFCSELVFLALRDGGRVPGLQVYDVAPWPAELPRLGLFTREVKILTAKDLKDPRQRPRPKAPGPSTIDRGRGSP